MRPIQRYKTSRMWNINANIVAADVVSTAMTALIIEVIQKSLLSRSALIATTAIIDGAISLFVFAGLHYFANQNRGVKDVVRVQIHRWMLSPLHYLLASGLQYVLLGMGVEVGLSVLVAYLLAVIVCRLLHTLYGHKRGLFE